MADIVIGDAGTEFAALEKNVVTTLVAGTSVGVGNTAVITAQSGVPFEGRYLIIRMVESGNQTDTVATVKAGVTGQTPANLAASGDLALAAASDTLDRFIVLELARFLQSNNTVRIDVSGTAGGALTMSYYTIGRGV